MLLPIWEHGLKRFKVIAKQRQHGLLPIWEHGLKRQSRQAYKERSRCSLYDSVD